MSEATTLGDIVRPRLGVSNGVSRNGSPIGIPRSGSNLTAQRLKYGEPWFEMKYRSFPFGAQRGLSAQEWSAAT